MKLVLEHARGKSTCDKSSLDLLLSDSFEYFMQKCLAAAVANLFHTKTVLST